MTRQKLFFITIITLAMNIPSYMAFSPLGIIVSLIISFIAIYFAFLNSKQQ